MPAIRQKSTDARKTISAFSGPLEMVWDHTRDRGHFYIRVADINIEGTVVSVGTQWLFDNYASFLINDPDVILVAPIREVAA